jgi:hypothetical protein
MSTCIRVAPYTPLTLLLHSSYTPLTRLLHASYTPLTRLLHASYTPRTYVWVTDPLLLYRFLRREVCVYRRQVAAALHYNI